MENKYFRITNPFDRSYMVRILPEFKEKLYIYARNKNLDKDTISYDILSEMISSVRKTIHLGVFEIYATVNRGILEKDTYLYIRIVGSSAITINEIESKILLYIENEILPECVHVFSLRSMVLYKMKNDTEYTLRAFLSWFGVNNKPSFDHMYQRIFAEE
jgi:hypothetical protein